ncbi:hypothetical protein GJ496_009024 [Pomphorhynchus laevis]|nr:hypothetical protein GJ496_009024 [Pomphorhynchus laevis]
MDSDQASQSNDITLADLNSTPNGPCDNLINNDFSIRRTNFIIGDTSNNPLTGVLYSLNNAKYKRFDGFPITNKSEHFDLHYSIVILNLPASFIIKDLIALLDSIPDFSKLTTAFINPASINEKQMYNKHASQPCFNLKRTQLGMQLDDINTNDNQDGNERNIDRYFALVCVHVDRVRLQRRRAKSEAILTVDDIAEMLFSSFRSAIDNQQLLSSKQNQGNKICVEFAVDCDILPVKEGNSCCSLNTESADITAAQSYTQSISNMIRLNKNEKINKESDCPICLEQFGSLRLITLICSHSFHLHCIGQHLLSRCPLCRLPIPVPYVRDCYFQIKQEMAHHCAECGSEDDENSRLLLCLVCGYIACPLHSTTHFETTSHGYGIELWGAFTRQSYCHDRSCNYHQQSNHRAVAIQRGQRIWNHQSSCWVQRLVSDTTGVHFAEIVSETKPLPENDHDCCQQLNALCVQFMHVLSQSMEAKNERFEQQLNSINGEFSEKIALLRKERDNLESMLDKFGNDSLDIEKCILENQIKLQELKNDNSRVQSKLKQIQNDSITIDRSASTINREIVEYEYTIRDLNFHESARSRLLQASQGTVACEREFDDGDVTVKTMNDESLSDTDKMNPGSKKSKKRRRR